MQTLLNKELKPVKIVDSIDLNEIRDTFEYLLYVPNLLLKSQIITKIVEYISKSLREQYKLKILIGYQNLEPSGIVMCQIHPTYTSYGRKCGTFGWLNALDFETCKTLIEKCELFLLKNNIRRLRGNINFPKGLGGLGIQAEGFGEQMMYGVSFNDSKSKLIPYLERLGYKKESEYICMKVTEKTWDMGKNIDKSIRLRYITLKEMRAREPEFRELIKNSFQGSLPMPDASGCYRFNEILDTYSQVPNSHYKIPNAFNPKEYSRIPEFVEAWEGCELEKVVTWAPLAFDRRTGKLVGGILGLPDLYENWLGATLTRANIDTIMVDRTYAGKGIFSALNNIGQLTGYLNGITYCEGTSIWNNNPNAIKAIFPHGKPIRKHYVMQKRIKKRR